MLFYFIRGSSFCITVPNLNVIFSANCHKSWSSASIVFISVFFFWAIFRCRSPQAGFIKLEWWVEAIFWKNPGERGEFTLIVPLKYHVARNGGTIVNVFLCRSVDVISHLLRHFRQVLTIEKSSEYRNLSVGVAGSTLLKILWIGRWAEHHAAEMVELPRIPIVPNQATTDARNLCHWNNCSWISWNS